MFSFEILKILVFLTFDSPSVTPRAPFQNEPLQWGWAGPHSEQPCPSRLRPAHTHSGRLAHLLALMQAGVALSREVDGRVEETRQQASQRARGSVEL